MAARVLEGAHLPGQIAGIDVAEPGLLADLDSTQQGLDWSVGRFFHLVVGMEGGDVPRDIRRDAGKKLGRALQLIRRVVETGDDERDDLEPEAHLVERADGPQDGLEAAAKLAVVVIVK